MTHILQIFKIYFLETHLLYFYSNSIGIPPYSQIVKKNGAGYGNGLVLNGRQPSSEPCNDDLFH